MPEIEIGAVAGTEGAIAWDGRFTADRAGHGPHLAKRGRTWPEPVCRRNVQHPHDEDLALRGRMKGQFVKCAGWVGMIT